jgi:hypothetical protein
MEVPEGFGDFRRGEQLIRTVKYADDLVLLAKEEAVLQGMIDRLTETEIKVMKVSKQQAPIQIMIYQKQSEDVEYSNYLRSIISNEARRTCKIKPRRTAMTKATLDKQTNLFTSKLGLNLRKKLAKCFAWC